MNYELILIIVLTVVLFIAGALLLIKYIKLKGLNGIRKDVYRLFLEAEHQFTETEAGLKKMDYVVQLARSMLPKPLQVFITDAMLKKIIQIWFNGIKDLLDDGKINKSKEDEKNE